MQNKPTALQTKDSKLKYSLYDIVKGNKIHMLLITFHLMSIIVQVINVGFKFKIFFHIGIHLSVFRFPNDILKNFLLKQNYIR